MNILFLMKPLDYVKPEKDTSLLFMQASQRLGHSIYFLPQGGASITPDGLVFDVFLVSCTGDNEFPFDLKPQQRLYENDVDVIFIRTDPPFDDAYLHDMWVLDRLSDRVRCINSPAGIRTVNEKLWLTQFRDLIPKTWVTTSRDMLESVLAEQGQLILKPTNGFGGQSIFLLSQDDVNKHVILDTMFAKATAYVLAQEVLADATNGDKRILLCDGEPIGAVLRVHSVDDHRNNLDVGGQALAADITGRDEQIIDVLKPQLLSLGLRFVGIDVIGDYLIEVNVTSPTCLQELNNLVGYQHEDDIIRQFLG